MIGESAAGIVVRIGSTVRVKDGDDTDTWVIAPAGESDATEGRISEDSPMAKAVLGHEAGEVVKVTGPRRTWVVLILDVS